MTNREFFVAVSKCENVPADLREFAENSIAKLDAKLSSRAAKDAEKRAAENAPLIAKIREILTGGGMTTADIAAALEVHTSKASPLLRKMVESGELTMEEVKIPKKGKVKKYSLV